MTAEVREVVPIWSQSSLEVPIAIVPGLPVFDGDLAQALERLTEEIREAIQRHVGTEGRAPAKFDVADLEQAPHRFDQVAIVELGAGRHPLVVMEASRFGYRLLDHNVEYAVQPIVGCLKCEPRLLTFREGDWEARRPDGLPAATIRCASSHPRALQVRVISRSGLVDPDTLRAMEASLNQALEPIPEGEPPRPATPTARLVVDLDVVAP